MVEGTGGIAAFATYQHGFLDIPCRYHHGYALEDSRQGDDGGDGDAVNGLGHYRAWQRPIPSRQSELRCRWPRRLPSASVTVADTVEPAVPSQTSLAGSAVILRSAGGPTTVNLTDL